MSSKNKRIKKILSGVAVSYDDAEKILEELGFEFEVTGSHHVFRKKGYAKNISLKKRARLLHYQIKLIKEVLTDHGYSKENL